MKGQFGRSCFLTVVAVLSPVALTQAQSAAETKSSYQSHNHNQIIAAYSGARSWPLHAEGGL